MLDTERWTRGYCCMANTLKSHGDIVDTLKTLGLAGGSQASADHLSGALNLLLKAYFTVRSIGRVPRYQDQAIDAFMHQDQHKLVAVLDIGLNSKAEKAYEQLGWICGAVSQFKGKVNCILLDSHGKPVFAAREAKK